MSDKNETDLNKYKRDGTLLKPPLAQLNMSITSWINERLPDMLWAVLVISQLEREEALEFFRHCLSYIEGNKQLCSITLTAIDKFPPEHRTGFINHALSYKKIKIVPILRPLLLFQALPAFTEWRNAIGEDSDPKEDWEKLGKGIKECLGHQSQEATDCRWVKVVALIISGKLQCPRDMVEKILSYPNKGDQKEVRPMIRATEIAPGPETVTSEWSSIFWKECYDRTACIPEQGVKDEIKDKYIDLQKELEDTKKSYYEQTQKVRNELINHFFNTSTTSGVDARHEAVFGLSLYGLQNFIENNLHRTGLAINGRAMLRALLEAYATLAYLVKKEAEDMRVWEDYRSYGSGQANLIYRKFEENSFASSAVKKEVMETIANEDKWVEFVTINLGHWDSSDLRKICDYIGEKNLYDKYYGYTSGFIHANWAAVRESMFQKCFNPLHRLHRVPGYDLPLMSSVTKDMIEIVNKILELVSISYPRFDLRIQPAQTAPAKL